MHAHTFHKIQGRTINRLILDLNKWPHGKLTHAMVLVGLTRVRDLAHIRTMPLLPGQSFKHLYTLRADSLMLAWTSVFLGPNVPSENRGTWCEDRAKQALAKYNADLLLSSKQKKPVSKPKHPPVKKTASNQEFEREPAQASSTTEQHKLIKKRNSNISLKSPKKGCDNSLEIAKPAAPSKRKKSSALAISNRVKISQAYVSNFNDLPNNQGLFKSYANCGNGHCMFESVRQSLNIESDSEWTIQHLRDEVIQHIYLNNTPADRIIALNEHKYRELDFHNNSWRSDDLNEQTPEATIHSMVFNEQWSRYIHEMQHNAYTGGKEIAAVCQLLDVNIAVWKYNEVRNTAEITATFNTSTNRDETVHLLYLGEHHYEFLDLPKTFCPLYQESVCRRRGRLPNASALRQSSAPTILDLNDENLSDKKTSCQ